MRAQQQANPEPRNGHATRTKFMKGAGYLHDLLGGEQRQPWIIWRDMADCNRRETKKGRQ